MFSAIRRRMTWVNVAMTLALVFAMTGGAYAAKKYLITSTKQISPKVLKQLEGKAGQSGQQGPAGPQGPQGAPGKEGASGAPGKDGVPGKDGAPGKNVTVSESASGCAEGGVTVEVEGAAGKHEICNGEEGKEGKAGKEGSPWTAGGTLPSNKTETGVWSAGKLSEAAVPANEFVRVPISFPIPLAAALGESQVHLLNKEGMELVSFGSPVTSEKCHGNVTKPSADQGNLCIYVDASTGVNSLFLGKLMIETPVEPSGAFEVGASVAGAYLQLPPEEKAAELQAYGTWAVAAP